jgi:hypothetical protein
LKKNTLQRNEAQLTDKYRITAVLKVEMDIIISITASPNDTHMMKISIFWGRKVETLIKIIEELNKTRIVHGSHVLSKIKTKWGMLEEDLPNIILAKFASFDMCWSTRKDMYCLRHNHARPMSVVANENNVTLFREVYCKMRLFAIKYSIKFEEKLINIIREA